MLMFQSLPPLLASGYTNVLGLEDSFTFMPPTSHALFRKVQSHSPQSVAILYLLNSFIHITTQSLQAMSEFTMAANSTPPSWSFLSFSALHFLLPWGSL
jgi:hypothetical protein